MEKFAQYIYDNYMREDVILGKSKVLYFFCYNMCPSKTCNGKDRSHEFKQNIKCLKNNDIRSASPKFIDFLKSLLISNKELEYFKNDFKSTDLSDYLKHNNTTDLNFYDFYLILTKQ